MSSLAGWLQTLPEPLRTLGRGERTECPLCGTRSRRFRPCGWDVPVLGELRVIGAGRRDGAVCPRCKSTDRERLIWLYLQNAARMSTADRVLHVAPERALGRRLQENLRVGYVTVDLASPRACVRADLQALPFPDRLFDTVICNHVLEHVPNDRLALTEIHRVLRPSGWAILQVPYSPLLDTTREDESVITPEGREHAFGQHDHLRLYGRDYPGRLQWAGFQVQFWSPPLEAYRRHSLFPGEKLFIARKDG